jgi:hypothetical protein
MALRQQVLVQQVLELPPRVWASEWVWQVVDLELTREAWASAHEL